MAAPYEICPEDYLMSMVWKRTPAGDMAFNRCPLNATGTVLLWSSLLSEKGKRNLLLCVLDSSQYQNQKHFRVGMSGTRKASVGMLVRKGRAGRIGAVSSTRQRPACLHCGEG